MSGGSFGAPERQRRDVEPYVTELSLLCYSESARNDRTGSSISRTTLTSWTHRLTITNDTVASENSWVNKLVYNNTFQDS